jgi:hypothetical protein
MHQTLYPHLNSACCFTELHLLFDFCSPSKRSASRSLLTYYIHIDLAGSVPAWAANLVTKKQPLCIDSIRTLFRTD